MITLACWNGLQIGHHRVVVSDLLLQTREGPAGGSHDAPQGRHSQSRNYIHTLRTSCLVVSSLSSTERCRPLSLRHASNIGAPPPTLYGALRPSTGIDRQTSKTSTCSATMRLLLDASGSNTTSLSCSRQLIPLQRSITIGGKRQLTESSSSILKGRFFDPCTARLCFRSNASILRCCTRVSFALPGAPGWVAAGSVGAIWTDRGGPLDLRDEED